MDNPNKRPVAPLTEVELAVARAAVDPFKDDGELVSPVPADVPAIPLVHSKWGKPSATWTYRDAKGEMLFCVCRFDPNGERKQFLPLSLWRESSGALQWRWKGVPVLRPLYGLDKLAANPGASVVICEGEKSADAAAKVFPRSVAMASPGGSQAAGKADWAPLAGRQVLIWPDADEPGGKYADTVSTNLCGLGCSVSIVDALALASLTPDGGYREPVKGWDAADAIAEWENLGVLRKAAHGLAGAFARGTGVFETRPEAQTNWTMALTCALDIKPEPIHWLWREWLARGKMHVMAGQPGVGKSTIAIKMAASVSAGTPWPDGTSVEQGNVVIWSGEDDIADTLVPRLEASGANLSRIFFASELTCGKERRAFDPAKDIPALQAAIEASGGAVLLIVDPIVSATAADSHKNSETRRGLQPLVDMAAKLDAALLGITHFTKGSEGRSPIDRVTGSVAFGALARVVMVAARQQDGDDGKPGSRILMRAKSNIGPDEGGFNYELQSVPMRDHPDIVASVISWGTTVAGNAREILAEAEDAHDKEAVSKLQEAVDFLFGLLMDGPKSAKEIKKEAGDFGLAWTAVRRAQDKLGIKPKKQGMDGGWMWALPQDQQGSSPEGAHQNTKMLKNPCQENMSTFANREHLRGVSEAVSDGWEGEI